VRESVRKPYVIYNVVLGNQIYPHQVAGMKKEGYLENGLWTKANVAAHWPQAVRGGKIDGSALLGLPEKDRLAVGALLFQYHCNDCHAEKAGYSAVAPLLRGHSPLLIRATIEHLDQAHFFMPPWAGTPEEAHLLTEYLAGIAPPRPRGMIPEAPATEAR